MTLLLLSVLSVIGRLGLLGLAARHTYRAMDVAPGQLRRRHVIAASVLLAGAVVRL